MSGRAWFVVAGALFAAGLALSGMSRPDKVTGFLDFAGAWDASLAFVMLGAVGVYGVAARLVAGRRRALFGAALPAPPSSAIDGRLVAGAALFGVGWGLGGFCPGPALLWVGAGLPAGIVFVVAMIAGIALHDLLLRPSASGDDAP